MTVFDPIQLFEAARVNVRHEEASPRVLYG